MVILSFSVDGSTCGSCESYWAHFLWNDYRAMCVVDVCSERGWNWLGWSDEKAHGGWNTFGHTTLSHFSAFSSLLFLNKRLRENVWFTGILSSLAISPEISGVESSHTIFLLTEKCFDGVQTKMSNGNLKILPLSHFSALLLMMAIYRKYPLYFTSSIAIFGVTAWKNRKSEVCVIGKSYTIRVNDFLHVDDSGQMRIKTVYHIILSHFYDFMIIIPIPRKFTYLCPIKSMGLQVN